MFVRGFRRVVRLLRRRPADDTAEVSDLMPVLAEAPWMHLAAEFADTRFRAMVRRLPALVRQALVLAWRASPVDTGLAVGLNLVSGALTAFGLLATRGVLQALFAEGPTTARIEAALPSLALVAGAAAVRAGLQLTAGWAQSRLEPQVAHVVEAQMYDLATRVELAAFDDAGFADELDQARYRGTEATKWLVSHAINLITALMGVVGAAAALFVLHPLLVAVLLIAALPRGWAAVHAAHVEYASLFRRIARRRRLMLLSQLMAGRETAAELRAYTMRGYLLDEFDRITRAETAADLDVARRQMAARLLGGVLAGVATAGVYVVLGMLLISGAVPLAAAGTAVLALQSAQPALQQVIYQINMLYEEGLYFRDYTEFCARAMARIGAAATVPAPGAFQEIRLDDVSLRYPDTETPALDGVSLTIRRGQTVALVGENGSGKTTLARLLAGLYAPTAGHIWWDSRPLDGADPDELRERIAVVTQDFHCWPFTARQNIQIGRHTRRDGDPPIQAAARAAGAHDMIVGLPYGYDTLLDRTFKDGHELSVGQWQRIAVARGFYRDAPLLICDEPSASLDARAEHALFQQLRSHADGRTTVLITHRLANVRHADHIYVLHDGRLVEQGTHDELMAEGGRYAELFTLQASGYQAEAPDPRPRR